MSTIASPTAGVSGRGKGSILEMDYEEWRRVMRVNLDGVFFTFRAAARHMVERGKGGSLVAMASTAAIEGAARSSHYGASKGGVCAMVRALAVELARYKITVNSILPGWIETEMTANAFGNEKFAGNVLPRIPERRWGVGADFGPIAVYLASGATQLHDGARLRHRRRLYPVLARSTLGETRMIKTFAASLAVALLVAAAGLGAAAEAGAPATPAAGAHRRDRYIGYYYPKPTSTEIFESTHADDRRRRPRRNACSSSPSCRRARIQSAYRVPYAVFVKGEKADKLIIVGLQPGELNTIYRMRALLANMTTMSRLSPFFQERTVAEDATFFDLLKLLGFTR